MFLFAFPSKTFLLYAFMKIATNVSNLIYLCLHSSIPYCTLLHEINQLNYSISNPFISMLYAVCTTPLLMIYHIYQRICDNREAPTRFRDKAGRFCVIVILSGYFMPHYVSSRLPFELLSIIYILYLLLGFGLYRLFRIDFLLLKQLN